jgi:hypothetical protein
VPLAYEVMPGDARDNTTLRGFLERLQRQYGKARRFWLTDRGIPTGEVLAAGRHPEGVEVKLLPQDGELYAFAQSRGRIAKERAIRRRQLKWL